MPPIPVADDWYIVIPFGVTGIDPSGEVFEGTRLSEIMIFKTSDMDLAAQAAFDKGATEVVCVLGVHYVRP